MAWTATKESVQLVDGVIVVSVIFTDGVSQKFKRLYRSEFLSPDWPDREIRSRLDGLDSLDLSKIKLGTPDAAPVNSIPISPVPVEKTKAELDRLKWFADYYSERTQRLLEGCSPELQSRYLPEYGDIG